jgi:hypothetical protein
VNAYDYSQIYLKDGSASQIFHPHILMWCPANPQYLSIQNSIDIFLKRLEMEDKFSTFDKKSLFHGMVKSLVFYKDMSTLKSIYPKVVTHEFSYLHQFPFSWNEFQMLHPDLEEQKEIVANVCVPWVKTMRSGYEGFGCLACNDEAIPQFCVEIEIRPRGALVQFHSWCGKDDCREHVFKLASRSTEPRCSSCLRFGEQVDLKLCVNCKVIVSLTGRLHFIVQGIVKSNIIDSTSGNVAI